MIKYIDKGTSRQHLTDRLIESALNNAGFREDADAVFLDIAKNRLPVWLDELPAYDVAEVKRGRWLITDAYPHKVYCSECYATLIPNVEWFKTYEIASNYCPNCGAKMDEAEE